MGGGGVKEQGKSCCKVSQRTSLETEPRILGGFALEEEGRREGGLLIATLKSASKPGVFQTSEPPP